MKISIALYFMIAFIAGCRTNHYSLVEKDQLNYPPLIISHPQPFTPPEPPIPAHLVVAEVIHIRDYVGGIHSGNTWSHFHLTLQIVKGTLPQRSTATFFDYHTANRNNRFEVGQSLTFVFTEAGQLWGIDGIIPVYPKVVTVEDIQQNP